jgi:predicted RNase H-like nuclease (RuvC/YqgF family)
MIPSRVALIGWTAAAAAALSLACQLPKGSEKPSPRGARVDTVYRNVNVRDPELEQRVARLELRVLEKAAEIEQLQARLDEARREVVRAMAKLQTIASRAEAASGMAEAELAMQSLKNAAPQAPELTQARGLLQSSNEEFEKENYGGALYLATQAKSVVTSGQNRLASAPDRGTLRAGEVLFALPLKLETQGKSNVRDGPGTAFKILFTLETGSAVVAYAYADQWVRISDEGGRSGWVFYNLVGKGN